LHEQLIERLEPQASRLDRGTVIRMMELLGQALGDIKAGLDGRLQLELTVVKVTQPHLDLSLEGLDARLRRLEEGAAPVASDTPTAPTRVAPATATPATPTPPGPHDAAPASVAEEAPASVAEEAPASVAEEAPASVAEEAPATDEPASVAEEPARVADNGPMPAPPLEEEPAPPLDDEPAPPLDDEPAPPPGDDPAPPPEGPAPQAAESPAPQTAAPLLQRAQESWPQIIERLGSHSPPAASMLRGGRPCAERGGRITIAVGAQFNRDRLAESGNAAVVAGAVSEVLHQAVTVSFEVDASLVEQPAAAPERGRGLSIDEAIALSQEKLGARLIDDENGR
jgi:DNA polymerase III gamma/tau subunit